MRARGADERELPHRFFPATQIDVVWFPDGPGGDRFEEKEFRGPLSAILRDAIDFIARNYLKESKRPAKPASMKPAAVDVEWAGV